MLNAKQPKRTLLARIDIKQPGMFLLVNLAFAVLLFIFYFIRGFLSWPFYAFWFVFYLELAQAAWISSEPQEKIRYRFTYAALGLTTGFIILLSLAEYLTFAMRRPCFIISLAGFLMCLAGLLLENRGVRNLGFCFSEHIKLPRRLVTAGLYKQVRHPIYTGAMMIAVGLPLILNSYYALSASLLYIVLILIRVELEEKTLRRELPGYAAYAKRTNKFFPPPLPTP